MASPPKRRALLSALLVWGLAAPAAAEEEEPPAAPKVRLDRLLELPGGRTYEIEKKGGRTESEWRRRFDEVREALAGEREALAKAERELEEMAAATEPWQVAPPLPGVTTAEAPLDFQLRQEIRRHRSEIERLENRLLELQVEADLASVPADWRS